MTMYSFQPLPIINTADSHVVFYILSVILLAMLVSHISDWVRGHEEISVAWVGLLLSIFLVSGVISYNTGEHVIPTNEKVVGKFIRYVPEGYNETVQSGKSRTRQDVHLLYVEYEVEGSSVLLRANTGVQYPKLVTLYKN